MATFVGLQDSKGTVFQINLDQVRYIQPLQDGGSAVYFDDQLSLNVVNPPENIAAWGEHKGSA
jgi:hypothetical protein